MIPGFPLPINDVQAEAAKEGFKFGNTALEIVQGAGAATGKAIGPLVSDIVGWAFADALATARWENAQTRWNDARARVRARGVDPDGPISPAVVIPILEGACDENRSELSELWTRLLTNAIDPTTSSRIRRRYARIIMALDPPDAVVFEKFQNIPVDLTIENAQDRISAISLLDKDEVQVSFDNLAEQGLLELDQGVSRVHGASFKFSRISSTPLGRQFWSAISA